MVLHLAAGQMELVLGAFLAQALRSSVRRRLPRGLRVQRGHSLVHDGYLAALLDLRACDLARIHGWTLGTGLVSRSGIVQSDGRGVDGLAG